ncbi:hypothetical protein SynMITS9220_01217 [Synechococcus sp. MIT S9220]|nr:hypothetical protein SynMITS9220_01217 [Synechococcus sp. MIT S9220]
MHRSINCVRSVVRCRSELSGPPMTKAGVRAPAEWLNSQS